MRVDLDKGRREKALAVLRAMAEKRERAAALEEELVGVYNRVRPEIEHLGSDLGALRKKLEELAFEQLGFGAGDVVEDENGRLYELVSVKVYIPAVLTQAKRYEWPSGLNGDRFVLRPPQYFDAAGDPLDLLDPGAVLAVLVAGRELTRNLRPRYATPTQLLRRSLRRWVRPGEAAKAEAGGGRKGGGA